MSLPKASNTLFAACFSSAAGKSSRFGSPPAKEITDRSDVTFSISRMNDRGTSEMRSEKMVSICIPPVQLRETCGVVAYLAAKSEAQNPKYETNSNYQNTNDQDVWD